jgi:hypothetical protein
VQSAGRGRESYRTDQHLALDNVQYTPRWHHGSGHVGQWLPAQAFGLAAIEQQAPEPEGALPARVFDAKRRVQLPAIVASKRSRPSQGLGQLASAGETDERGLASQHELNDDGHVFCRHRRQPQSESPGSRTLDLPASPRTASQERIGPLEVRGDPGRILVGCRRRTGLLVPGVRVLAVVQVLGELRQLQRIEGVAHHGKLVRLGHSN